MLVCSDDFVGCPPNVGVLIPIELSKGVVDSVFQPFGTAVTDDVEDPGSDSDIFIVDELENSVPEDIDIPENFAWA